MTLFQFDQMFLIVPKFDWSCFNSPNMMKVVGICPNVSKCIQIKMKWLYIIQAGVKLFEVP